MTNNKSPFKKSLQPWFLFSHKRRKYMPLNNYSLLLHHNSSSLGIHKTMFETKFQCKNVEWTMMQNAPYLHHLYHLWLSLLLKFWMTKNIKIQNSYMTGLKITKPPWCSCTHWELFNGIKSATPIPQELALQFPKKFRNEFDQILSHEKYSKFNRQNGQQKFHLHPIKV